MRLIPLIVTLFALSACSPAPHDSPAIAAKPEAGDPSAVNMKAPTIVMLGDSLTAGYQLGENEALPVVLQKDLAAKGVRTHFVNAGVSGDTTADALARYDWSVTGSGANLLVLALGANDFLNHLPADIAKKNLAAILSRAKSDNIPVALVGVAIPSANRTPAEGAYAAIYPDLSKQFGAPYFPDMLGAVAGRPALLQPDGLHPTAQGVEAIAANLADFLAPVVKSLD